MDAGLIRLRAQAVALGRRAKGGKPPALPALWLFTDPDRTPDLLALIARAPEGCGLVLRTFGRREVLAQAGRAAAAARARGLVLLVGADDGLAAAIGADGVHLPQRLVHQGPRLRARFPLWRITAAAHDGRALRRAEAAGADAAFLSPVLPSRSPSAGRPLGAVRTAALVRGAELPVYALGGVDARTAKRLGGTGVAGFAGIGLSAADAEDRRVKT